MASNSQDTSIDAYPQAIVSNYEEVFGRLRLFNVAQKQLLQAICDGASDADLRSHLHSTLRKITDDANEVEKDVKRREKEQQAIVNAVNTILVVAALIGSATFASGLQPPLGYSPFYGSASLQLGAPSPLGMYPSYASVEGHPKMPYFCVFNALSFVFATATLVTGVAAARPPPTQVYTEAVVLYWRSIPRHISIELANLFQETLKTAASRQKCAETIPKKLVFCHFLWKAGNLRRNLPFPENLLFGVL